MCGLRTEAVEITPSSDIAKYVFETPSDAAYMGRATVHR